MFIHTKHILITSFYLEKIPIYCRIRDESALTRNFLRNGPVRGVNRSGVRELIPCINSPEFNFNFISLSFRIVLVLIRAMIIRAPFRELKRGRRN